MAGAATTLGEFSELDDLSREVYGVLGIPIDAIDMAGVVRCVHSAAAAGAPFLISTPNSNFLVASQTSPEFRESLLVSNLCPPDGMPVVCIARLLGVPLIGRTAGSDVFEALKQVSDPLRRLRVFLFGGDTGFAAAACEQLNANQCGLSCVGAMNPGFGSIDEMSTDAIINAINESMASFLVVSLGANKGQAWLLKNHSRLRIPVRSHLGAAVGFQAGMLRRAPLGLRAWGLEWLWRIKEEPQLWRRYWDDGLALSRMVLTRVLPLIVRLQWQRYFVRARRLEVVIYYERGPKTATLKLSGSADAESVTRAISCFRSVLAAQVNVVMDLSEICAIDARFIGCLLMLRKQLKTAHRSLEIVNVPWQIERILRLNGFEYLLAMPD